MVLIPFVFSVVVVLGFLFGPSRDSCAVFKCPSVLWRVHDAGGASAQLNGTGPWFEFSVRLVWTGDTTRPWKQQNDYDYKWTHIIFVCCFFNSVLFCFFLLLLFLDGGRLHDNESKASTVLQKWPDFGGRVALWVARCQNLKENGSWEALFFSTSDYNNCQLNGFIYTCKSEAFAAESKGNFDCEALSSFYLYTT